MNTKAMLQKLFTRYGILGAQSASVRGCYEEPVPAVLIKKSAAAAQSEELHKCK